jgi:hypothetical protein
LRKRLIRRQAVTERLAEPVLHAAAQPPVLAHMARRPVLAFTIRISGLEFSAHASVGILQRSRQTTAVKPDIDQVNHRIPLARTLADFRFRGCCHSMTEPESYRE